MKANLVPKGLIIVILLIVLLLPVGSSFYTYFVRKSYQYLIEAPCDNKIEVCFSRDCTNPDDCPPNGLTEYKQYYISAKDFAACSDNSCTAECSGGLITCIPIPCGEAEEDSCTTVAE